jgi:hypothetical protein
MTPTQGVERLSSFVRRLTADGVKSRSDWAAWRKVEANAAYMAECFDYHQGEGMPPIFHLVKPDFHAQLPLILLNYTQIAHNTLHNFQHGWVPMLKLCRGIVFDSEGTLVAFPFPKFFNWGEQGKMHKRRPERPEATLKEDGHLAIIFQYRKRVLATTRGSFTSSSAKLANRLLAGHRARIKKNVPAHITLLAELIHPDTKVIVDYGDRIEFRVNGAFDLRTLADFPHEELSVIAQKAGFPVVDLLPLKTHQEVIDFAKDPQYRNIEGVVVRWPNGEREKYKCVPYIGLMIGGKLTHTYVMNQIMAGTFEKKFADLPAEVQLRADQLRMQVTRIRTIAGDKKDQWQYMYSLLEAPTPYNKAICRKFWHWLDENGYL